jgi:hypothetical protein
VNPNYGEFAADFWNVESCRFRGISAVCRHSDSQDPFPLAVFKAVLPFAHFVDASLNPFTRVIADFLQRTGSHS